MKHTYQVTGMTCEGCEYKVKHLLSQVPHVTAVEVSKDTRTATIAMDTHISVQDFQAVLPDKYQISEQTHSMHSAPVEEHRTWLETYKPVLLIFLYITVITGMIQWSKGHFDLMMWMQHFMAGFFLVFSFFKILNLRGFAESYAMYDIVAKKIPAWGYIYAFVELGLGLAYLIGFNPFVTNLITLIVMTVSIIGVLQSVLNRRRIRCACLGAVFNLPMSTITIIEDALMIVMSGVMLMTMR